MVCSSALHKIINICEYALDCMHKPFYGKRVILVHCVNAADEPVVADTQSTSQHFNVSLVSFPDPP